MEHVALRTKALMALATVGALFLGYHLGYKWNYNKLYDKAEAIAIRKYGDKGFRLEDFEKKEWFRDMNVNEQKPSPKQLKYFIRNNPLK